MSPDRPHTAEIASVRASLAELGTVAGRAETRLSPATRRMARRPPGRAGADRRGDRRTGRPARGHGGACWRHWPRTATLPVDYHEDAAGQIDQILV